MPRIWEIISRFKDSCKGRGWKTCESEDWVEVDDNYHNFLWARGVHLSSFKKIASNGKCVIREGLSYKVVHASYTAWLFSERLSDDLIKTVSENPSYTNAIALYDLSSLLGGKSVCARLNLTDSPVFEEFESFLRNELKVKFKPVILGSNSRISPDNLTVMETA